MKSNGSLYSCMEKNVTQLLRSVQVPVSSGYVEHLITHHPDYPSFASISDTLERLGITHCVRRVRKEQLYYTPFPFLLQTARHQPKLLLIRKTNEISRVNSDLDDEAIIIQVESTTNIVDEENKRRLMDERLVKRSLVTLCTCLLLLMSFFIDHAFDLKILVLFVTALVGVLLGLMAIGKSIGARSNLIASFCGRKNECAKILSDNNLWPLPITLSETATSYFIVQTVLISLTVMGTESLVTVLEILSFAGILAVLYSIYHQAVVVRSSCRICLAIDLILIIQLIVFNPNPLTISLDIHHSLYLAFAFIGMTIFNCFFIVLRIHFKAFLETKHQYRLSSYVKHSEKTFMHLLRNQPRVKSQEAGLVVGNIGAPVKILVVTNLYCMPCKILHQNISQILTTFPGKVNLTIILAPTEKKKHADAAVTPAQYFIQYWTENFHAHSDSDTASFVHQWFELMNLDLLSKRLPLKGSISEQTLSTETAHYEWCQQHNIHQTPTVFVNDFLLPRGYEINDLMLQIPNLENVFRTEKEMKSSIAYVQ